MDGTEVPLIAIELALVLGGALGLGWWQLRDVRLAREQTARQRQADAAAAAAADTAADTEAAAALDASAAGGGPAPAA